MSLSPWNTWTWRNCWLHMCIEKLFVTNAGIPCLQGVCAPIYNTCQTSIWTSWVAHHPIHKFVARFVVKEVTTWCMLNTYTMYLVAKFSICSWLEAIEKKNHSSDLGKNWCRLQVITIYSHECVFSSIAILADMVQGWMKEVNRNFGRVCHEV